MKRKIFYLVCFVVVACSINSCNAISKNCKTCKKVYYDKSGNKTSEDSPAEYCGVELLGIDGKTVDLGALGTAKWVCN
jgi:hypothetical protein